MVKHLLVAATLGLVSFTCVNNAQADWLNLGNWFSKGQDSSSSGASSSTSSGSQSSTTTSTADQSTTDFNAIQNDCNKLNQAISSGDFDAANSQLDQLVRDRQSYYDHVKQASKGSSSSGTAIASPVTVPATTHGKY